MQVIISAVGPDNRGLADPIIHHVTGLGANIAEIQMYDHDQRRVFAMLLRLELPADQFAGLGNALGMLHNARIGKTPLVVYAGQSPSNVLMQEPHLSGPLVDMARPIAKWATQVEHAHAIILERV